MKHLLLSIALGASLWAQTGAVCWMPDKTVPAKSVCIDVPPSVKKSVKDFADAQFNPPVPPATDPVPKYAGVGDVLLADVAALIDRILEQYPTTPIATDKAAAAASLAAADAKKAALLDRTPKAEPK